MTGVQAQRVLGGGSGMALLLHHGKLFKVGSGSGNLVAPSKLGAMVMRTTEPSETEFHRTAQSTPCPSPRIKLQSASARLGMRTNTAT